MNLSTNFIKATADVGAVGITVASIVGWLPSIAAALSIIWLSIQIGDYICKRLKKHSK